MINKIYSKRFKRHVWGFDERFNGVRVRDYSFTTKAEAEAVVTKLRNDERLASYGMSRPADAPRLSELCTEHLKTIGNKREHTRATRVLKTFAALFPSHTKIDNIATADIRGFIAKREADGVKGASIDRELNIISAALHAAPEYFPTLRQWVAPKIPRPKYPQRRRERLISDEERSALVNYLLRPRESNEQPQEAEARHRVGAIVRFAFLTGMRHGEINHLKWSDVDWTGRELRVVGTKTDSIRYLPLTATMEEILKEREGKTGTQYIFTRGGNTNPKFYRILKDACTACGIAYGKNDIDGMVLHDTRHTATTRMIQAGVDLATIGSITGHKDKSLILYYSHSTAKSRRNAAMVLDDDFDLEKAS